MKNCRAIKNSATSLILEVDTAALSKDEQLAFFGKEYSKIAVDEELMFIQQHDYEFSFDVLQHLGLDLRYKYLKQGEYRLEIAADKIQVLLTLSMH